MHLCENFKYQSLILNFLCKKKKKDQYITLDLSRAFSPAIGF
jgi:hypothetical protein